jgi:hypothetical protein
MKTRCVAMARWPVLCFVLSHCSGHGSAGGTGTVAQASYPGEDLGLPPVAAGFARYETHPVTVPAEQDVLWSEWVAPPLGSDMDVIAVSGLQSKGGHHAILYATTTVEPVGTSRKWQDGDQLTTRTVGGIGGEGNDAIGLPPGVVFRIKKGSALLIQSHFLNAGAEPLEGRSVLDVKLGPADPNAQVASLLANATLALSIAPGTRTTADVSCTVHKDFRVLMYANHMHAWGVSASTELVKADGTSTPLKVDPTWDPSWAFHPNYTRFPLQALAILPAGSTIHTTCTWSNTTNKTLSFPTEMCTFAGFYLGDSDAVCVNGQWQ